MNLTVILEIEGKAGICEVKMIKLAQHQSAVCSQVYKNISCNHLAPEFVSYSAKTLRIVQLNVVVILCEGDALGLHYFE